MIKIEIKNCLELYRFEKNSRICFNGQSPAIMSLPLPFNGANGYSGCTMNVTAIHPSSILSKQPLPFFLSGVAAGFPSPADDYIEKQLDLNELIVKHPASTFFVRVEGHSMVNAGIHSGDILAVDRSLEPASGKIVVAVINGEFTVKRIRIEADGVVLEAENSAYPAIKVSPESDFQVWGVVTYVIHQAK